MSVKAMKAAAPKADQLNAIWTAIVEGIEAALNAIVTEPNAKTILTAIEGYVNSLLGVGDKAQALAKVNALGDGKLIAVLLKLIGGLSGSAGGLQGLLSLISTLISSLK